MGRPLIPARILIVEDERITGEDLRDILTELGYVVVDVVSSGADAMLIARDNAPDLALMDIRIKGDMDGTEVARQLRSRFNIPVIYLTAHADNETLERAKLAQPLGYITKPFQEAELHANIEMALFKHAEDLKALEREEWLNSTLRALGQGVISVDKTGAVMLLNAAAEAWTGWSAADARGKTVHDVLLLVDSASGQRVMAALESVLQEGAMGDLGSGGLLVAKSGERRAVEGSIAPMRGHEGDISGAVIVFGGAGTASAAPPGSGDPAKEDEDGISIGDFKMVASSPKMKAVLRFARRVAESEASTILIEGESGTGKDVIAQFIHHFGNRRKGPFVSLNCAAIPDTLIESELFGYEKGAFTDARAAKAGILEIATGGTIFLDEIGEMPVQLQAKLLRVLEEQTFRRLGGVRDTHVDLRVMAATNRTLVEAIDQGRFRLDLLLPPQRDSGVDSAASREERGHSSARAVLQRVCTARASAAISRGCRGERKRRCWRTNGRATCASCATSWSAPRCWKKQPGYRTPACSWRCAGNRRRSRPRHAYRPAPRWKRRNGACCCMRWRLGIGTRRGPPPLWESAATRSATR